MSGLCGIWNLTGAPVEGSLLDRLSGLLAHRGLDGERRWNGGEIAFAFQNMWTTPDSVASHQPVVRAETSVVMFDGRLDNRDDLLNLLEQDDTVSRESSDAELVSAAYGKYGEGFAEQLNGDFAAAVYDLRHRRLLLARDAIGVRPLYFARIGRSFVVASEVKPILAHPSMVPRPNADMLAAALLGCMGQERQGWTFFADIFSVLPGQMVIVTRESIAKRTYFDFGGEAALRLRRAGDYVDAFRDVFERAVRRRLRSQVPVAVAISGGVDSSSVFCMAETIRRRGPDLYPAVVGVSMEVEARLSDERAYLEAIERQYGSVIRRVPSKVRYAAGSLTQVFRDAETPYFRGPVDSTYPFHRAIRETGARVQLSGLWGDQMLADAGYLIDFVHRLQWLQVWRHLTEQTRWNGGGSVRSQATGFLRDVIRYHTPDWLWRALRNQRRRLIAYRGWYTASFLDRASRAETLQQFRPPLTTAHGRSLYQFVRPMYYVQALEMANKIAALNGCECAYPFFDRDLISFLLAIPGGVACNRGVPKAILRSAMAGILPAVIAERNWKAQNTEEVSGAMAREFEGLSTCLETGAMSLALGFVDEAQLRARLPGLKERMQDGTGAIAQQFGDVFGLELWLQTFFGNGMEWRGRTDVKKESRFGRTVAQEAVS